MLDAPFNVSTSAIVIAKDAALKSPASSSMTPVIGTSLDDWLRQSYGHIPTITLLKLDLEGGERRALEGASGAINSCRFMVIELNSERSSGAERAKMISYLGSTFDTFLVQEKNGLSANTMRLGAKPFLRNSIGQISCWSAGNE